MKVNIYINPQLEEEHVDIHCIEESRKIKGIVEYINDVPKEIFGKLENGTHRISLNDILYFESVDKRVFAYTEESVYEVEFTLKQVGDLFEKIGFIRISKSSIVNIYMIDYIKNDFEMRTLVYLCNQEKLIVNRRYRKGFQNSLNMLKEKLLGGSYEVNK